MTLTTLEQVEQVPKTKKRKADSQLFPGKLFILVCYLFYSVGFVAYLSKSF
jgi:hypothetical protein